MPDRNEQMREAAEKGDRAALERLINDGADIESTDNEGYTALHDAARMGREDCVDLLVEEKANVNAQNNNKYTPLMLAANCGRPSTVQTLLLARADPTLKNMGGKTALDIAKMMSHTECIRKLEDPAAVLAQADRNEQMRTAANNGDRAALERLINDGADIESTDQEGSTALHEAAWYGRDDCVDLLVEENANVNAQNKYGWTPLVWAAAGGHPSTVQTLLLARADPTLKDKKGYTALDWAKGCKSEDKDPLNGNKPLSQEGMAEYTECIRKLEDPAAVLAQATPAPTHKEGDVVRVVGLTSKPQFNGLEARVLFYDEDKGRYAVELDVGGTITQLSLKRMNVVAPAPAPKRKAPAGAPTPPATRPKAGSSSSSPPPPQPPPSIQAHVQSMGRPALVEALETLGVPANTRTDAQLRERLRELVEPHADGWEAALAAARRRCLVQFLGDCGRTASDAERVASARLEGCTSVAQFRAMWFALMSEYCPPAPSAPDRPATDKILVIAPGFGIMATPAQIRTLERAFKSAVVCSNQHANPEESGFDMAAGIQPILQEIKQHKPKAILCASKGGLYMRELWRRMEAGGHDHLKGVGYLMINVNPSLTRLPLGVKIILVQGAKEDKWPRPRGYNNAGKVQDGSLEALVRTGSPGLCYLYYTADVNSKWGYREGDTHVPASLLQYDCLPRLVDSLLASSSPGAAFQASSRAFVSAERIAAENGLGWHPNTLRSRFVGTEDDLVEVPRVSDEFKHVETIFKADPAEIDGRKIDRFYFKDRGTDLLTITKIERVQNRSLKDSVDDKRGRVKKMIEAAGETYEAGVHSRWLFHGARDLDALDNIINNPVAGFAPQMGLGNGGTNLWGYGSYFARDASYSIHAHYCDECRDAEGNKMILLCLVECGLSCVGEGGPGGDDPMRIMPTVHPSRKQLTYMSYVDYAANPEIFVTMGEQAYPAYIIHFG